MKWYQEKLSKPGYVPGSRVLRKVIPVRRVLRKDVQNLQKFRVWVWISYITHGISRYSYGYGSLPELTEVPGVVAQKFRAGIKCYARTPGILARAYRNHRGSG